MKYDLVVIDGLNKCHQLYWVHRNLVDEKGRGTGLLYGFIYWFLSTIYCSK